MVRPERFELPTLWFEAKCSIQLSYGRTLCGEFTAQVNRKLILQGRSSGASPSALSQARARALLRPHALWNRLHNVQSGAAQQSQDDRATQSAGVVLHAHRLFRLAHLHAAHAVNIPHLGERKLCALAGSGAVAVHNIELSHAFILAAVEAWPARCRHRPAPIGKTNRACRLQLRHE